jgi:hypothetical protein
MVAIAHGLMARPRLLMIDEPFLGLASLMVREIAGLMRRIQDEPGIPIAFIEQERGAGATARRPRLHHGIRPDHPDRTVGGTAPVGGGQAHLPGRRRALISVGIQGTPASRLG